MKIESITRGSNNPHIDYEFNRGFTKKYLEKIEFGTKVTAIFEKTSDPRYVMIETIKKKGKFYSPISLHQSSDRLIRKIETIFEGMKELGYIRFKGK